jgi:adenylate cyclase
MAPQEHKVERRLAAIFAADVAGYSHVMEQDEVGTLRTLTAYREIMDRIVAVSSSLLLREFQIGT